MDNLYRQTPPVFKTVDQIEILPSEKIMLSNNIPVHVINGGSQEVVKIEFIFNAGVYNQKSPIIASMANTMLNEGTSKYNAADIAEKFDFYGAYIGFSTGKHDASVSLYTLNKYAEETLKITENLIKDSIFPEKEFQTILLNKKQRFQIDHQKTNILAKERFSQLVYGENHPYANTFSIDEFNKLNRQDVISFYNQHYTPNNCEIIIAGIVSQEILDLLEELFGAKAWPLSNDAAVHTHSIQSLSNKKNFVYKEDAVQACIRIGRQLFNKTHEDYTGMQLLNLILGGYFGSRLMQNIREDKGYTYGINSIMISHEESGHFTIVTEVGAEVCKDATNEIFKEIKRLRDELVGEDELNLVKNYISGEMLRNLDSPFALSDSLKGNIPFGYDNSFYQKFIKDLKDIEAKTIKTLANKYLKEEDLYLVICGPKECESAIQ
jgi:predicted Zn-dependent peptidase